VDKNRVKSPVGKRLKEARLEKGISQKKLGILAGIDQFSASARINQYERDKHIPDYSTATRLADALEVPVTFLFADNEELAELILGFSKSSEQVKEKVKNILKS